MFNPFIQLYTGDLLSLSANRPLVSRPYNFDYTLYLRRRDQGLAKPWRPDRVSTCPWYLEVDELTMTVALVAVPARAGDYDPSFWRSIPFLTFRLYNWKYTT